ncbi:MAG: chemotaxis protein CheX [Candidatus Hydrogenedentes bacterium]|nr:chemotaxis protein CheX [Candidatus Hydrogenedentota bacterium]
MKVEYINPFIESVYDLFATMLDAEVQRGEIGVTSAGGNPREIMALIGLSGPARGTVAISFPAQTALAMVGKILGVDTRVVDDTVSDGIAEIVNIVAGSAKARLTQGGGTPIDLSLPTVVRGNSYSIDYPSQAVWLEVPFTSELGAFSLRVTFDFKSPQDRKEVG